MGKSFTVVVDYDNKTGDTILPLPDELMLEAGWNLGDTVQWIDNKDGTFQLVKKEQEPATEWVLVDAVSTFRMRYMVEVPKGKSEWALDTVSMNEAKEFSQEHIGEQIVSHRVVSFDEAIAISDIDNHYCKKWTTEQKVNAFFTKSEPEESTIVPMPGTSGSAKVKRPEDVCAICKLTRDQLGSHACYAYNCGLN